MDHPFLSKHYGKEPTHLGDAISVSRCWSGYFIGLNLKKEPKAVDKTLRLNAVSSIVSNPVIPPGLKKVPPFPPVAAKLLTLLSNPAVEISEVAAVISSDPSLTACLLGRVNSMEFGFSHAVTNVRQAVALLGIDRTRLITLTLTTAAYTRKAATVEMTRCWHHSLASAVLAEEIAYSAGAFVNLAFVAGILHDLGRLALLVAFPKEYKRVIRRAEKECVEILDFEQQEFGINHAEAGRLLAETWKLPEEVRMITGRHHDPCEGAELDLLRIVHIACRLARVLGFGILPPEAQLDITAVIGELPAQAMKSLLKAPEDLRAQIEKRISTFL